MIWGLMAKNLERTKPQWVDHQLHLQAIAKAALGAVDPFDAVNRYLRLQNDLLLVGEEKIFLDEDTKIYVVGAGKAGVSMARAVEKILGERIYGSYLSVPDLPAEPLSLIRLSQGGHPLPTEGSIQAGHEIKALLERVCEKDLVLVLISGGGSALLELPLEGLRLSDLQKVNDLLIKSGAPIQDINIVRRHLSLIKGGGLARLASPAQTVALILSDVVGDPLEAIASGPTVLNIADRKDVWEVVQRYKLESRLPVIVKHALETYRGVKYTAPEVSTEKVINIIIGSNRIAAEAAVTKAERLGFRGILLTTMIQGEARQVGRYIASLVKAVKIPEELVPLCIVLGGETTVTVQGTGIGGRNQELALAAALDLEDTPNIAVMTFATDGIDGPTPSAGAVIHGGTVSKANSLGLEARSFLKNNDSHTFFNEMGDAINLGPTGTNVNDLVFCLIYGA
jgi:glycerate 2-kinase